MRVCVVGGGISGLTAAYRLQQAGAEVELLEGAQRVGGLLGTELIEQSIVETGADSILTEKPWALRLAQELGLADKIIATRQGPRGAYIVHDGKLQRIPVGFSLLAPTDLLAFVRSPLLSARGKARALRELILPARDPDAGDESLEDFVVRRFGRELFDRLAQPLAGGIYGADPKKLSLMATMPRFVALEREYGSVIRGLREKAKAAGANGQAASGARYGLFAAFSGGMQTLVDALQEPLAALTQTGSLVTALERDERGYRVEVHGSLRSFDAVVLAVPAYVAAQLLTSIDHELAHALGGIEYGSAATVSFGWPRAAIPHALDAFGYVVPVIENRATIASTWASVKYAGRAPADKALLRVFIGGHRGQHLVQYGDEELITLARRDLRELLGVTALPEWTKVVRYLRAMPQYHVGHLARVARIEQLEKRHLRFALAGNALRGVGIPDAIKSGEEAATRVLAHT